MLIILTLFPPILCFLKCHIHLFLLFTLSNRWHVPSPASQQAWQTVANQTSTGTPTAKRMVRMAILPTALPTGRMDITVEQLHILERQVGKRIWCVCDCACIHEHAALIFFTHTARWLWVNVIGSTVQSLSNRRLNRAYSFTLEWFLNMSSLQKLEDIPVVSQDTWLWVVVLLKWLRMQKVD